jgi:rhodanese-related sulfurtransferase
MNNVSVQNKNSVTARELHRRLAEGGPADLLDVRTPPEHAAAHIAGVQLMPLDQLNPAAFLKGRNDAKRPLYVICQSGGRASRAIEQFRRAGFDGCILLEGGTQAWMDAGLPVERDESRVLPLMRQVQIVIGAVSAAGAAAALWVNPLFAIIPLFTGCGLLFAGITGFCGLALLLAKMPWNRRSVCASTTCCN